MTGHPPLRGSQLESRFLSCTAVPTTSPPSLGQPNLWFGCKPPEIPLSLNLGSITTPFFFSLLHTTTCLRTYTCFHLLLPGTQERKFEIMTSYGTIPTSGAGIELISHAKARAMEALAARRPWKEMVHRHALSLPSGAGGALLRLRSNLAYFRMNYAIVVLFVVFVSLLWHPVSLIVFLVMSVAWLCLYFLRDEPLVLFGRTVGDVLVLGVLSVVTLVALFLTGVALNLVVALLVAAAAVLLHAVLRRTDDLFVEQEGMYSVVVDSGRPSTSAS